MHILQKIPLELLRSDISDENYRVPRPILWYFEAAEIAHIKNKYPYSDATRYHNRHFKHAERTKILQTWHKHFPETHLQIGKKIKGPYEITKRIGPIFIRIWFDFRRDYCRVNYWNTNWALNQKNNILYHDDLFWGVSETIDVETWEQDTARLIEVAEFRKNKMIPLSGDVSLDDIFKVYDNYRSGIMEAATPMLVAGWCGEIQKAEEYYLFALKKIAKEFLYSLAEPWIEETFFFDKSVYFIDKKPAPLGIEESFEKTLKVLDERFSNNDLGKAAERLQNIKNTLDSYKQMIYRPEELRRNSKEALLLLKNSAEEFMPYYSLPPYQPIVGVSYNEE